MVETLVKDNLTYYTNTGHQLTAKQEAFIQYYIKSGNSAYAAEQAGYLANNRETTKTYSSIAQDLLSERHIREEIEYRRNVLKNASIAQASEVLQFYTSVMRGEQLDQFGIEASLDTRLKAANELAKHQIEIPLKLKQKEKSNALGSIKINFLPRKKKED